MRLKALDQIHVSAVQADSLRPNQEFDVSDAAGADLMKAHPGKFEQLDEPEPTSAAEKAEPPVKNKDEGAPSKNKSATSAKKKA